MVDDEVVASLRPVSSPGHLLRGIAGLCQREHQDPGYGEEDPEPSAKPEPSPAVNGVFEACVHERHYCNLSAGRAAEA